LAIGIGTAETSARSATVDRVDASRAVDQPELIDGWTDSKRPGRFGWLFASIWLAYLGPTLQSAWEIDQPVRRVAAVATVLVFAAGYAHTFYVARHSRWMGERLHNLSSSERIIRLSLAIGLTVLGCSLIGQSGLAFTVYLVVTAIIMLPLRAGIAFVAATMVAVEIATRTIPGWKVDNGLLFSLFVSALAIWGITQMVARNVQLAGARAEIAALAVAQERSRFARDLHDLLGHSLTVVTVKAELAGRLIAIDPDRAEKEIADVERLARDALADVRAAVSGYREVTLATELVSARTALEAAGIIAELP
jgi:two-component system sensor histidine kinase DesK